LRKGRSQNNVVFVGIKTNISAQHVIAELVPSNAVSNINFNSNVLVSGIKYFPFRITHLWKCKEIIVSSMKP